MVTSCPEGANMHPVNRSEKPGDFQQPLKIEKKRTGQLQRAHWQDLINFSHDNRTGPGEFNLCQDQHRT
jgi:hypothetical protein